MFQVFTVKWNVFRYAGDLLHLLSVFMLLVKITATQSVRGTHSTILLCFYKSLPKDILFAHADSPNLTPRLGLFFSIPLIYLF